MIELVAGRRVLAYARPTDLRKGYDGLAALVEQEMGGSPLSGDLYLSCRATASGRRCCTGMAAACAS
jgi:hypothetical protein